MPLSRSKGESGLSCEIVSDLCPNPFSHDWHVQPDFQRPNRDPPERRAFSPSGTTLVRLQTSSKPYKHTVRRKTLSTDSSHRISRCFPQREIEGLSFRTGRYPARNLLQRSTCLLKHATVWPSASTGAAIRAHGEAEDRKLRKDPAFGGPCLEGTLQKPASVNLGFRIQSRGRDN
jgi:hypothetical protein